MIEFITTNSIHFTVYLYILQCSCYSIQFFLISININKILIYVINLLLKYIKNVVSLGSKMIKHKTNIFQLDLHIY